MCITLHTFPKAKWPYRGIYYYSNSNIYQSREVMVISQAQGSYAIYLSQYYTEARDFKRTRYN